ncbi:MAG: hypothetical protein Q611_LSC00071G0001, partial [Leuconostoc sp. DORA_2]
SQVIEGQIVCVFTSGVHELNESG